MYNLFLEEADLLEAVEIVNLLNEEVITETSIAGMRITKENLQDEKFVKELIKEIKNYKVDKKDPSSVRKFFNGLFCIIMLISAMSIVLLPVVFLIGAITSRFTAEAKSEKDLKKLDDCIDKTIKKLENQKSRSKEKEKYDDAINRLKSNRELIYNRSKALSVINVVDNSKYDDRGCIKVGNISLATLAGGLSEKNVTWLDNHLKNLKKYINKWNKEDFSFSNFGYIEQLAYYNIDNNKFLKLIDESSNKGNASSDMFDDWEDDYLNNKYKKLVNKTLTYVYTEEYHHITYILYCHEDKCCYAVNLDYESVDKITVQQLLQASKIAYNDMLKLIKEYDKK